MPFFGTLADLAAFGDVAEPADEAGLDGATTLRGSRPSRLRKRIVK